MAYPPVFDTHLFAFNQTVKIGEVAKFDCIFTTHSEAGFDWYKVIHHDNYTELKKVKVSNYQI